MVVGSISLQFVAMCNQFIGQGASISNHLFGIGLPGGLTSLQQSGSNTSNSLGKFSSDNCFFNVKRKKTDIVVRAALAGWEDGIIHSFLKVGCPLRIFPEKD